MVVGRSVLAWSQDATQARTQTEPTGFSKNLGMEGPLL